MNESSFQLTNLSFLIGSFSPRSLVEIVSAIHGFLLGFFPEIISLMLSNLKDSEPRQR